MRKPKAINATCSSCGKEMHSRAVDKTKVLCRPCKALPPPKPCETCGILTKNPKFCSSSCSAIYTGKHFPKRTLTRKCRRCENLAASYKDALCLPCKEAYHADRFLHKSAENTLEDYWNKPSLKNLHMSSKNAHIRGLGRSQHKELLKQPCANCAYDKHVELCHIKPIKDFLPTDKIKDVNSPSNIIQLCRNCHWEFDHHLLSLEDLT